MPESQSTVPEAIFRERLAELLNEDLSREYHAIIAYVVYSQVLSGAQYMDIAAQLEIHAKQELDHALTISRQVDYLGKMPAVSPKPVRTSNDAKDMLRYDLASENDTSGITATASGSAKRSESTPWRSRFAASSCRNRAIKSIWPPRSANLSRTSAGLRQESPRHAVETLRTDRADLAGLFAPEVSVRPVSLIFALLTAASLGGCARPADIAAEERTIRELEKKWVRAVTANDTTAIGNVYAEDGEFLPPGAPRASGRAAVRSAWAAILKAPNLSLTFEASEVVVSSAGDLAVATGPYTLGMDGPKGQRIEDAGKFVEAWTRVNGEWKVLGNIFNSDRSPM